MADAGNNLWNQNYKLKIAKGSLSYLLCSEYFSQFKIDSETYTYLAAFLKETKWSQNKEKF